LRNLSKIAEGKTVIIVSHRLSTLVNSDQIFVFDRGEMTARGRHGQLLESSSIYKTLWDQQSRHMI
jgi:ATP-binding cassette subfamily B protein